MKFFTLFAFLILASCNSKDKAQDIIDKAIEASGGQLFDSKSFSFDFRQYHINAFHTLDSFYYERTYTDSLGKNIEYVSPNNVTKYINGGRQLLNKKKSRAIHNSINSQIYFVMLPQRLNDPAVNKTFAGIEKISGKTYQRIAVTFNDENGGDDAEDNYLYWIDSEDFSLDYLAYNFQVDDGGVRFRKAYNTRTVNGIVFQDYINYKHEDKLMPLNQLAELYQSNSLQELSKIELQNIKTKQTK